MSFLTEMNKLTEGTSPQSLVDEFIEIQQDAAMVGNSAYWEDVLGVMRKNHADEKIDWYAFQSDFEDITGYDISEYMQA